MKTDIMSFEMYKKTVDDLEKMGTIGLILSGGEPMTNPKFIDFLKLANEKGFAVSVLSNLTLLNDEIIEQLYC